MGLTGVLDGKATGSILNVLFAESVKISDLYYSYLQSACINKLGFRFVVN